MLGHAHLGKGSSRSGIREILIVMVQFQLYDIKTLETIMTHELGPTH